jgi:hypothetical protein
MQAEEVALSASRVMPALAVISVLFGVLVLWVFKRASNQERLRETKRLLLAHLYELRLFTDEPSLVWKAQLSLLRENLRYIGLSLVPALIIAVPAFVLFMQLEALYGRAPLQPGEAAIVTAHWTGPLDLAATAPVLLAPDGIAVESPAVRIPAEREISWRIRAVRETSGMLRILLPEGAVEKRIETGSGPRYVSERRVRSWLELLWSPTERRLPASSIDRIEIRYPPAVVSWLGLEMSWLIWLLILSSITILLLRPRFRVTF